MAKIYTADRWSIITWKKEGFGARTIHRKLKKVLNKNYSLTGIQNIINKFMNSGSVTNKNRLRKKTARTDDNINSVRKELGKKTPRSSSPKRTPNRMAQKL